MLTGEAVRRRCRQVRWWIGRFHSPAVTNNAPHRAPPIADTWYIRYVRTYQYLRERVRRGYDATGRSNLLAGARRNGVVSRGAWPAVARSVGRCNHRLSFPRAVDRPRNREEVGGRRQIEQGGRDSDACYVCPVNWDFTARINNGIIIIGTSLHSCRCRYRRNGWTDASAGFLTHNTQRTQCH